MKVLVAQSCPTFCDPMDHIACQAPLSMEFPSQEYWSRLPFPSPGGLPDPGIEPASPALQTDSLLSASTRIKSLATAAADLQLILKNVQDEDQV